MVAKVSAMRENWYCYGAMMSPGSGSSFLVRRWSETTRLKPVRVIQMMSAGPGGQSHCCCSVQVSFQCHFSVQIEHCANLLPL